MVLRFHDGRFHEIAGLIQDPPPIEDGPSCLLHFLESSPIGLDRRMIYQWTHEYTWLQWIPDADLFVGGDQFCHHFIVTRFMDEQPSGCRATLTGCPDRTEHDGANSQGEVRRLIHDDGVVSAQLQECPSQPLSHGRGHSSTDRYGSGEGDQRKSNVPDHCLRKRLLGRYEQ